MIGRKTCSGFAFLYCAAAAVALLSGCPADNGGASAWKRSGSDPIKIVCTTGMVADLVRNVGGEQVEVTQLMGEGVDPHLYQASTGDVSALDKADLVFYSGLHLEANLVSTFESLAARKPAFAVASELERWSPGELISTGKDSHDPHVWFDVSLWSRNLKLVADRLGDYDPQHALEYAENARAYMRRLAALHEFCRRELKTIPEQQRVLVTAHDAFHYFGKAYGIEVKAIQGVTTASEASIKQVEQLADFMVQNNIKAVFVESSINPRTIEQLIAQCRSKGHQVVRGGELFSDAMGKQGTEEGTYEGMIRHNVNTIVRALK